MSEQNQNPSPAMSAEEYQRGVATQQLEAGMAVAEEARNPMTGYARVIETDDGVLVRTSDMSSRDSYGGNDGFPQDRARLAKSADWTAD